MLKWIEWKWGLAMILYPSKEELVFWVHTPLHGPLRCRKLETVLYCSFRNNTSIIHWENTNIAMLKNVLAICYKLRSVNFLQGFLIKIDEFRVIVGEWTNLHQVIFILFFICSCLPAYEVMQCDHSIDSLQHNRHCFFVFILFPKKIYDLTVSMVLEIVYQK